jgi:hypothetical protein
VSRGAIVAFGDSITDGTCSTLDAHDLEDVLMPSLGLPAGIRGARKRVNEASAATRSLAKG